MAADDDDDESLTALTAAFRDRRLAGLLLPIAVIEIALSWIEAVTPLYANNAGTLTPSGVGLLFTYAGAARRAVSASGDPGVGAHQRLQDRAGQQAARRRWPLPAC